MPPHFTETKDDTAYDTSHITVETKEGYNKANWIFRVWFW
jgi:hypothetical protein